MRPVTENKIVLVTRRTRLDDLIARFNTIEQAKFYVEHLGADFSDYLREHQRYRAAVGEAEAALSALGRLQTIDRWFLPNFVFGKSDTVVVIGQDGLVANTLKYADAQPVVAVNPDSERWDGVLLPFRTRDLSTVIPEVFLRRRQIKTVTMARAELNNGQRLYAVNDLFVGARTHVSARYVIETENAREQHSSSGIVISTGLGSTGWFKSLITGALAVASVWEAQPHPQIAVDGFAWDADYLYYTVREPFPSKTTAATMVFGKIATGRALRVLSQMPENGVIFSDGVESDYLEFNSGALTTISVADKAGHLVV